MNKSTIIKKEIMEILSDKKEHNTSEIKTAIRKKYADMDITEGVFSNSFRTLTLAKKCINKERGIYIINTDKNSVIDEKKNIKEDRINKCCDENNSNEEKYSSDYIKLQSCVSKMLVQWREEFRNLVKDINILDADDEVVSYILEVRHALDNLEKGIRK